MDTITLRTGQQMPCLALGTWRLSGDACSRAVATALELGYRHLDTAAMYRNEAEVGAGIRASGVPREEIFVTTKLAGRDHSNPGRAVQASAKRLGVEYVDCYLIHWPAGSGADLEVWADLERLHGEGTLRAIGVSNYSPAQLEELVEEADVPPAVNQVEMNPFVFPRDVLRSCRAHGVAVQAYSPLGKATDLDHPVLVSVAERHRRTTAQVMLRWGLQHGAAVLPKSANRGRIAENAVVFDFELSEADMKALDDLG